VNTAKCFEIALYDGIDPAIGKQVGLRTGKFEDFQSVDDLIRAFYFQLDNACHEVGEVISRQRVVRRSILPVLFQSALIENCIKKGEHSQGYGGRFTFGYMISVGMIDAADSIAAIKKCVFEDCSIGKSEVIEALKANFEGKEKVLKLLLAAPKYGNDDDYVDEIAAKLYSDWRKMVVGIDGPFGTKWLPGPYSVAYHGSCGRKVGALPRGRKGGIALADGSVSACQGMDVNGPTAIIKSSGKIDQCSLFQNLFNLKFQPDTLKTREDIEKFLALVEVFFDYKGRQIQFNVVDRKTLLDAQAHPENYRNLIVRVAGFSALFTELNVQIQNEIIGRVEHRL
jgi:formate C-acetyltransferase